MQPVSHSNPGTEHVPIHRDRNVISALAGVIGFFLIMAWGAWAGSRGDAVGAFVDIPSALIVIIAPMALMTAIYGLAGVIDAFGWIVRKPAPGKMAQDAVNFFQLSAAFAMGSGLIATLLGFVIILKNLGDPERIGPGMAISLLSQLYGVFGAVVCIGIAAYIARKHNGPKSVAPLSRRAVGVAGITAIAGCLTAIVIFGIMLLALVVVK